MSHTHPCETCGKPIECSGGLERNYDGIPETICRSYHHPWGEVAHVACEDCARGGLACGECDRPLCSECGHCHWCTMGEPGECRQPARA